MQNKSVRRGHNIRCVGAIVSMGAKAIFQRMTKYSHFQLTVTSLLHILVAHCSSALYLLNKKKVGGTWSFLHRKCSVNRPKSFFKTFRAKILAAWSN